MLYKRCLDTIALLLDAEKPLTVLRLAEMLLVSARTVRNDLETIDEWLSEFGHMRIVRVPGVGIFLDDGDGAIRNRLKTDDFNGYIMSAQERVRVIIGILLIGDGKTSLTAIADKLGVSGATVSNDIQKVKKQMDHWGIRMVSKPHTGITIQDNERNIRRGCVMLLRETLETGTRREELIGARFLQAKDILAHYRLFAFCETLVCRRDAMLNIIERLRKDEGAGISDNGFCAMFLYLLIDFTRVRQGHMVQFSPHERRLLAEKPGINYSGIREYIREQMGQELSENEILMINLEWMSLRKFGDSRRVCVDDAMTARELLKTIREGLDLEFDSDENTISEIAAHLNIMSYRLLLNVTAENNPVLNEIEAAFPEVCSVVREKLRTLLCAKTENINVCVKMM